MAERVTPTPKRIRFSPAMPFAMENILAHRFGYNVIYNQSERCLTAVRRTSGLIVTRPTIRYGADGTLLFPEKISELEKEALEIRCDRIVEYFPDPYNAVMAVRTRLHNMAQGLSPAKRQFVLDWMEDNFSEDLANLPNRKFKKVV